jgi:hypothetical protein
MMLFCYLSIISTSERVLDHCLVLENCFIKIYRKIDEDDDDGGDDDDNDDDDDDDGDDDDDDDGNLANIKQKTSKISPFTSHHIT